MLKEFYWDTFIKTGNIDAYILFKEIEEKNNILQDRVVATEEVAVSN